MFHYSGGILIQSRIYPQGNDGNTDLYKVFRGFVQKEFASLLNLNANIWVKKSGSVGNYVYSIGSHYRDYTCFSSSNISYPKEYGDTITQWAVRIGHNGICPYCGEEYSNSGSLSHGYCEINN
jgi:hypothetical protein